MSVTISYAKTEEDLNQVENLTRSYLAWDLGQFREATGIALELDEYVSNTLDHVAEYMPPSGRLVMARDDVGNLRGLVLLRRLARDSAEIKRLFVDPNARGAGIGKRLVEAALQEARTIGYHQVFLDTGAYMTAAHKLYQSFGFQQTGPYPGSENDEEVQEHLIFMTLEL